MPNMQKCDKCKQTGISHICTYKGPYSVSCKRRTLVMREGQKTGKAGIRHAQESSISATTCLTRR